MPYQIINGVNYYYRRKGSGSPLVLLHGFTGSSLSWEPFAEGVADWTDVVSIDLPGHGNTESPQSAERYAIEHTACDIVELTESLGFSHFSLLGYSMGGRLALFISHNYPKSISTLILESASPGIEDPRERQKRQNWDYALAESIEENGIRKFVNKWEQLPLFASQSAVSSGKRAALREQRLNSNPEGLANSLRGMGTSSQPSLWCKLPDIKSPTLLVCGELDSKYVRISREMAGLSPDVTLEIVPGAGHNVHFEQPVRFSAVVSSFLKRNE